MASGGSEAIAESFYAIMDMQQQRCYQSNKILELRTKLDWLLPHIGNNTDNLVEDVTDYHCHVCFDEVSGAHKCITCRRSVHVICGVALGNEGYGQAVKCYKCHET
ncbi:Hypothetical predicted protein, partial [Paramuricea clavata]